MQTSFFFFFFTMEVLKVDLNMSPFFWMKGKEIEVLLLFE